MISRPPALWRALLGILLVAAGLLAPRAAGTRLVRDALVERPFAICSAHGERDPGFQSLLAREADDLGLNVRLLACAAGVALIFTAFFLRTSSQCWTLVAAAIVSCWILVGQLRLIATGARDGLFTESEAAHRTRFFDRAADAADVLNAAIPSGARFLVIDFATPNDVNKIDYLSFPRRMFMLPGQVPTTSADEFRKLLVSRPDALAECRKQGYDYAVDLRRLVETLDPRAIVALGPERDG